MNDAVQNEIDRIAGSDTQTRVPMKKVQGERVTKTAARKALETFFEMDIDDVKKDLKRDAKRKLLSMLGEMLNSAIDRIFRQRGGVPSNGYGPNVKTIDQPSYRNYSTSSKPAQSQQTKSNKWSFSDLMWVKRSSAQDLLDGMYQAIVDNGSVTVAEVYDAIDDPSSLEATDSFFGWKDLSGAYIKEENGLYRLYLPTPISLK